MRGIGYLLTAFVLITAPALAQTPAPDQGVEGRAIEMITNGDPSDDAQAVALLQTAADAGSAEAMNGLAVLYMNGMGVPVDEARGRQLMERAAEMGSVGAHLTLSDAYMQGAGGYPRNLELSYQHAVAAAEADSHPRSVGWAQWRVGMMTLRGIGTTADPPRAFQWLRRAADNGSVPGMISLAVMLATADGVPADPPAARTWYERASQTGELGSAHALRGLGGMLAYGEGGPVDLARGYAYLLLAREGGDDRAQAILDALSPQMNASTEAEAQRIKTAWLQQYPAPRPEREGPRVN